MKQNVALFVTCIVDTVFPNIGEATVEVLEHAGVNAHFPESQTCCGQPAFNSGFQDDARAVAQSFIKTFERYDAIVTPSGSCAAMIKHFYPELFAHDPLAETARRVADRTHELSAYLVDVLGVSDLGAALKQPLRAALHDACHGLRGLGLNRQPRALLSRVKNLTLSELPGHDQCCGFGGLFAVKMSAISGAMLGDKLAAIQSNDADVIITGDASCMMHINGGLSRAGSKKRVLHLAEVLAGRI
jgi:L-lactate dehydrogenase complex protein LldE